MLKFFTRNNFRKEMTLVIIVKLIAIFLLWGLFFSHRDHEQLTKNGLNEHFIEDRRVD